MGKRNSKKSASHENQGSGSEKEFDNNKPTADDAQKGKENKYAPKFTYKDSKKVLRALFDYGYKSGTREFVRKANLRLSIDADETQIYEKVKSLRLTFVRRARSNKFKGLTGENARIHELAYKIWGGEKEAKVSIQHQEGKRSGGGGISTKKQQEKENVGGGSSGGGGGSGVSTNSNSKLEGKRVEKAEEKIDKFVKLVFMNPENDVSATDQHVLEAFQRAPIPQSEKMRLVKGWNELQARQSKLELRKRDLISQIIQAIEASPSV